MCYTAEDCCKLNLERGRYGGLVSESVLNRYLSILCNAGGFDAESFGAAVIPETDRAVLNVPSRIYLPTRLAHEAQRTNVCAGLTELS
jgi:hypothetical protein